MNANTNKFYGRTALLEEIIHRVLAEKPQNFALIGPRFLGKTRLLNHLGSPEGPLLGKEWEARRPRRFRDGANIVTVLLDCGWPEVRTDFLRSLADAVRARLDDRDHFPLAWDRVDEAQEPSRQLRQMARQLNARDYRLVVLLDNFEVLLDEGHLKPEELDDLRPLAPELVLIVAVKHALTDADYDRFASALLHEMLQTFMPLVEPAGVQEWLRDYDRTHPGIAQLADDLFEITGGHPYLLSRLPGVLLDLRERPEDRRSLTGDDLAYIRLRLAEHGRLLFEYLQRLLQEEPPPMLQKHVVAHLFDQLRQGSRALAMDSNPEKSALNWLINQRIVARADGGYRIFSPLFAEFMEDSLEGAVSFPAGESAAGASPAAAWARLSSLELRLLEYLREHSDRVVSLEELLSQVWGVPVDDGASTRRVQEAVRRLRLRLESLVPPIGRIENERGRGYRFVAYER